MLLRSTARAFRFRRDAAGSRGGADAERVVRLKGAGDDGAEEAREAAKGEAQEENLRLAYVALTRSRHQTVVLLDEAALHHESALAWLLHRGAPREERLRRRARRSGPSSARSAARHLRAQPRRAPAAPRRGPHRRACGSPRARRAAGRHLRPHLELHGLSRKAHALSPAEEGVDRDEDDVGG